MKKIPDNLYLILHGLIPEFPRLRLLLYLWIPVVSCSSPLYYQPVMLDQDRNYIPKPMVTDSVPALYSMSGSYTNSEYNSADLQHLYELNFSVARVRKNIQLSYGGYLFWGVYNNESLHQGDSYYFSTKKFGGYGLRGAINLVQTDGNLEFRLPGIEFCWSEESGQFAQFRRLLLQQMVHYTNPKSKLFTAGISNELIWKSSIHPSIRYAFKIFVGRTFGDMSYVNANSLPDEPKQVSPKLTMDTSFLFGMKQFYLVGSLTRFSAIKLTVGYAWGKRSNKPR